MATIVITPDTDLAPLIGRRVQVDRDMTNHGGPIGPCRFIGSFLNLGHYTPDAGGTFLDERTRRRTALALPYGDATITPLA